MSKKRRPRRPQESNRDKILTAVGVICAVAGVPAALVAGAPYSWVLLALALVIVPLFLLYQAVIRKSIFRSQSARMTMISATALWMVALSLLFTVERSRAYLLYEVVGLDAPPRLSQLTIPVGSDFSRVRIVAHNPAGRPQLITHLSISSQWEDPYRACGTNRKFYYEISSRVYLTHRDATSKSFFGSVEEGVDIVTDPDSSVAPSKPPVSVNLDGLIQGESCYGEKVSMGFDTTIPLASNDYTIVEVDIPTEVDVIDSTDPGQEGQLLPFHWPSRDLTVVATLGERGDTITIRHKGA